LRMGAPESSIGSSLPSGRNRTVWLARPTMSPERSTLSTGFSTGSRVVSLTITNTSCSGRPMGGEWSPISRSATALVKVTRPCTSAETTASPMLESVTRSRSEIASSSASASLRWLISLTRATSRSLSSRNRLAAACLADNRSITTAGPESDFGLYRQPSQRHSRGSEPATASLSAAGTRLRLRELALMTSSTASGSPVQNRASGWPLSSSGG
jgi:hypothetical protein